MEGSRLSTASYHPTEGNWDPQDYRDKTGLKMVTSIEQLIRAETFMGSLPSALPTQVTKMTEYLKREEDKHIWNIEPVTNADMRFNPKQPEQNNICFPTTTDTDDPWLTHRLTTIREEEAQLRSQRHDWYDTIREVYFDQMNGEIETQHGIGHYYESVILTDTDTDTNPVTELTGSHIDDTHITQSQLKPIQDCDGIDISEYGFDLPLPSILFNGPEGDEQYPLVPWCGVICSTCDCQARGTPCTHELIATFFFYSEWPPDGIELPTRFTRLCAPQAYTRWAAERPEPE